MNLYLNDFYILTFICLTLIFSSVLLVNETHSISICDYSRLTLCVRMAKNLILN